MEKRFLNIEELSQYLNIRKSKLYAMVEGGEIPCFRFGRLIRFKKQEIDAWVENHRQEVTDPNKEANEIFKGVKNPKMDIDHIVKEAVEAEKESRYNLDHGKPDRIKGLEKEVSDGTL